MGNNKLENRVKKGNAMPMSGIRISGSLLRLSDIMRI